MPTNKDDLVIGVRLEADEITKELRKVRKSINRFNKRIDAAGKKAGNSFNKAAKATAKTDEAVKQANKTTQKLGKTATAAGKKMDRAFAKSTKSARRFKQVLVGVAGFLFFRKILRGLGALVRGFGRSIRAAAEQQRWFRRLGSTASAFNATIVETQQFLSELTIATGFDRDQVRSSLRDLQERIAEGASDPFSEIGRSALLAGIDLDTVVGPGGIKDLEDLRKLRDEVIAFVRRTQDRGNVAYIVRALVGDESERVIQGLAALTDEQLEFVRNYTRDNLQLPFQLSPNNQAILNTAVENFDTGIKNLQSAVALGFLPALDAFNRQVGGDKFFEAFDRLAAEISVTVEDIIEQFSDPEFQEQMRGAFESLRDFFGYMLANLPRLTNLFKQILAWALSDEETLAEARREGIRLRGGTPIAEGVGPLIGIDTSKLGAVAGYGARGRRAPLAAANQEVADTAEDASSALQDVAEELEGVADEGRTLTRDERVQAKFEEYRQQRIDTQEQTAAGREGVASSERRLDRIFRDIIPEIERTYRRQSELLATGTDEQRDQALDFFQRARLYLPDGSPVEFNLTSRAARTQQIADFINTLILETKKGLEEVDGDFSSFAYEAGKTLRLAMDEIDEDLRRLRSPFAQNFAQSILAPFALSPDEERDVRRQALELAGISLEGLSSSEIADVIATNRDTLRPIYQKLIDEREIAFRELGAKLGDAFPLVQSFNEAVKATVPQQNQVFLDALRQFGIVDPNDIAGLPAETRKAFEQVLNAGLQAAEESNRERALRGLPPLDPNALRENERRLEESLSRSVQAGLVAGLQQGSRGFLDFFRNNLLNTLTELLAKSIAEGILEGLAREGASQFTRFITGALFGVNTDTSPDRFHGGGVVPGRVGQEVPIIALAGETIRTRQQERALRGGNGDVNVYFQGANFDAAFQRNMEQNARTAFALQQAQASVVDYGE